jgi:uncharacterized protein YbjT (DUF2867 family)
VRVPVTGSSVLVGSALVKELRAAGHEAVWLAFREASEK